MEDDSPWGEGTDFAPLPSIPPKDTSSPKLPSFQSSSTAKSWGDDGGWGGATDDYSLEYTSASIPTSELPFAPGLSTLDSSSSRGWGSANSPELPPIARLPASSDNAVEDLSVSELFLGPPSSVAPILASPLSQGFAPSPTFTSATLPTTYETHLADKEDDELPRGELQTPEGEEDEDDWGGHGASPTLPPIVLPSTVKESPEVGRGGGWGNDEEWQPAEIPAPLPTFGSSFQADLKPLERATNGEEGWGAGRWTGADSVGASTHTGDNTNGHNEWPSEITGELYRGKSIPAAFVDELKRNSREFAETNWKVSANSWDLSNFQEQSPAVPSLLSSLLEPPSLSSTSSIDADTPLPSLFRMTPTLYPNFRDGLDKTALRTAETLKGSAGPVSQRTARFGRGGMAANRSKSSMDDEETYDTRTEPLPSEPKITRGRAGDEFDLDAPGSTQPPKSSWWGGTPAIVHASTESPERVDSPPPAKLGRFFGRLIGKSSPATSPRTSGEGAEREWGSGKGNAGAVNEDPSERTTQTQLAAQKMESAVFGELPSMSRFPPPRGTVGSGLETLPDNFGNTARTRKLAASGRGTSKKQIAPADPFDPFGDDDEDEAVPPPISPITNYFTPSTTRSLSPPFKPGFRPISPPLQAPSPSSGDFSAIALAPPFTTSASTSNAQQEDDSFDAFFASIENSTKRYSSTTVQPLPNLSTRKEKIPPRTQTFSAPPRTSSAPSSSSLRVVTEPPSRSGTSSPTLFAPPPPPLQPVSRGFSIPPPPSFNSSVAFTPTLIPVVTHAPGVPQKPARPPQAGSGGPLSFDDLSFFESL